MLAIPMEPNRGRWIYRTDVTRPGHLPSGGDSPTRLRSRQWTRPSLFRDDKGRGMLRGGLAHSDHRARGVIGARVWKHNGGHI